MSWNKVERRKNPRTSLKGTVILLAGEHAQRGRITNLSEGGLLATTLIAAPIRLLGLPLDLELRIDDQNAKWLRLRGSIMRIEGPNIAIAFEESTSQIAQLAADMSHASSSNKRIITVVLIDEHASRRPRMAEAFRSVGCRVLETATTLEAIVTLGETTFEPDVIAIGDSIPMGTAEQMRAFVQFNHPDVRLVRIGNDVIAPVDTDWLSSTDPSADMLLRIRHLLANPHGN